MDTLKPSTTALSELALNELQNLQSEGLNPTWEQVVKVNDLCRKIESPKLAIVTATGKPEILQGRKFWPLTLAAAEWYTWAFSELDDIQLAFALLYAHEHAREDVFADMYDPEYAAKRLSEYKKTLTFTMSEALLLLGQLHEGEESKESGKKTDQEELIACIVAKTGIPPEYWKHRVSIDYVIKQIDAINAIDGDANGQKAKYIEAEKALGKYLMEIKNGG